MSGTLDWGNSFEDYLEQPETSSDIEEIDYPEDDIFGTSLASLVADSGSDVEEYSDVEFESLRRICRSLHKKKRRPPNRSAGGVRPLLGPDARCPICIDLVSKNDNAVFCTVSCGTLYHNTCWVQMIRWDRRCSICRFPGRCKFLASC